MLPRPILVALKGPDDWEVVVDERMIPNRYITASKRVIGHDEVKKTESWAERHLSVSATVGEEVSDPSWSYWKRIKFLITKKYKQYESRKNR